MKSKAAMAGDLFFLLYHLKRMESQGLISPGQYLEIAGKIRTDYSPGLFAD